MAMKNDLATTAKLVGLKRVIWPKSSNHAEFVDD